MTPLTKDLVRTGAIVAVATGSVLLPVRYLRHRAAEPPRTEKLAVQTFAVPLDGNDVQTIGIAINDNNEIVGTAFDEKNVRAFVFRSKKPELLPLPKGAPMSVAAGINADGIVVGTVGDDKKARGILWAGDKVGMLVSGQKNTSASTVSKSGGAAGVAMAKNQDLICFADFKRLSIETDKSTDLYEMSKPCYEASCLVVSISNNPDFSGMIWQRPGEGKAIGPFIPQAGSPSGTLVGLAVGKHGPTPAAMKNGKLGALPKPEGVKMAVPLAANDADVFVGAGVVDDNKVRPVGWSNGKTGFLPVPGGRQGVALGINDAKTVVGAVETEKGEAHAAVWKGGKVVDLNDLADKNSGWTLVQARGINNKGFVVGTAVKGEKLAAFVVKLGR